MDIEKAIEILEDILKEGRGLSGPDRFTAIRLGIEALKFRQRWEEQEGEDDFPRLPGETERSE